MEWHINDEFWKFIEENAHADASKLRLKYHNAKGTFDYGFAITQIECRRKFAKKLQRTLEIEHFLFPSVLAGEQATSDRLAAYHSAFIGPNDTIVDLTAGLGIDACHMAEASPGVIAIERDEPKAECLRHNFGDLLKDVANVDCRNYLGQCEDDAFDVAFIDPARRSVDGGRVFALADCEPNVLEMLPILKKKAKRLLIKASPMLDITNTLRELPGVRSIMAIGTPTECKEIFAQANLREEGLPIDDVVISAVTLAEDGQYRSINFTRREEAEAKAEIRRPEAGKYLLEPYPAVMKAAPYDFLSRRYGIGKISANTQLYIGDAPVEHFPGEAFKIVEVIPYESKCIKRLKGRYPKIQITARNFDMTADNLRKKLGVKDGGDKRLFAVTASSGEKLMVVAES